MKNRFLLIIVKNKGNTDTVNNKDSSAPASLSGESKIELNKQTALASIQAFNDHDIVK
jgi:hypothetical protein